MHHKISADDYHLEFPLFLALEPCGPSLRQIDVIRHRVLDESNRPCLPLFTDTDLAERFIKSAMIRNGIVVRIDNEDELLEVLQEIDDDDPEKEVVFDFQETSSVFIKARIETIIEVIETQE